MHTRISFILVILLSFILDGCLFSGSQKMEQEKPFELISIPAVDRVLLGGSYFVRIDAQKQFDQFLSERFEQPLKDYCKRNYPNLWAELLDKYPTKLPGELEDQYLEACLNLYIFSGDHVEIEVPEIDFANRTLILAGISASGCRSPDYQVRLTSNPAESTYTVSVTVTEYGYCEMGHYRNLWILAPKIPNSYQVELNTNYQLEPR